MRHVSWQKVDLAARAPYVISIKTIPDVVRIKVDHKKWELGKFIKTPITLEVAPGRRKVKISRPGYVAQIMNVEGDAGDRIRMEDIVLEQSPDMEFKPVSITSGDKGKTFHYQLDRGLYEGEIPTRLEDLDPSATHRLVIYPAWPEKEPQFACRFKLDDPELELKEIKVRLTKNGDIRFKGCRKVRKKKRKKDA